MRPSQPQNTEPVPLNADGAPSDRPTDSLVVACVDDSPYAGFVTDYAAWAAHRLDASLELLHVIDRSTDLSPDQDHSGALTANEQVHLLEKIVDEEERHSRMAREKGRVFLNALRLRALELGVSAVDVRQRHGTLADSLLERQSQMQLAVMGRRGESSTTAQSHRIGRNLERVARALKAPVLSVTDKFVEPRRVLIAFDGSRASRQGLEIIARTPAFEGLDCAMVMVKYRETAEAQSQLHQAADQLRQAGLIISTQFLIGDLATSIAKCIQAQQIDLLVMGAYTHSPWHSLIRASHTTKILRAADVATLLLR